MALAMLVHVRVAFAEPGERPDAAPDFAQPAKDRPFRRGELRIVDPQDPRATLRPSPMSEAAEPRGRRLSPEECRQLRRDIDDAGREIYRHARPDHPRRF